jgi:glycosyltransferase involved in cell wall biosynthesis
VKVLHVSEQISPIGGCERMLRESCRLLQEDGHTVLVAVAADSAVEDPPAPVCRLSRSWGLRSARRVCEEIEQLLAQVRPDVVHLHNIRNFLSPLLLRRLRQCAPTIRYVHDARLFCPRWASKRLARSGKVCSYAMGPRCLLHCHPIEDAPGDSVRMVELGLRYGELAATRRLDAILAGSDYMRQQLILNGFDASKVYVLPGFTDCARRPAPPSHEAHVLAIGRFDGAKGLEELPEVFARLRTPGWSATVVGAGHWLEASRRRAAELGLAGRIDFPGQLAAQKLDSLYRRAAAIAVPSRCVEAFGLVGVEAMAFGRPVVAYDLGGIREWLRHEQTGYLVPAGDQAALAGRLDALLADPVLARRMGQEARAQLEKRFRPAAYLQRLLGIYRDVSTARARR